MTIPIAPGVFDIVPDHPKEQWRSSFLWQYVEAVMRKTAHCYGYREIRTPVFERTELFQRSVGETTDIVSKEMYTFIDKGGRSMSLRPEGTAPAIRAFIDQQSHVQSSVSKLYYIEPMFRYERTQAGRYRQHHQFGIEAIGIPHPEQDAECIDLIYTILARLGLQHLRVGLNSIGSAACRQNYKIALKKYLSSVYDRLSEESKIRFEVNPLRILDSKDPEDIALTNHAPSILDFLNEESREHFEALKKLLHSMKIPFEINSRLVRGLDYYNKTVFEIVAGELGAQNSVVGGGRYDGLVKQLGGADLPSLGLGCGIERLIQTMLKQDIAVPAPHRPLLYVIPLGSAARQRCFEILHECRQRGISSQMDFSEKKLNKMMQTASQLESKYVVVIGDNELQEDAIELKNMDSGHKTQVALSGLVGRLLEEESF